MSIYKVSDEDVVALIRYLEMTRPHVATEAFARSFLEFLADQVHYKVRDTALLDPENLDTYLADYEKHLKR